MYDLQYVRKRRRRRIAAFVALFASIGVTSLVITSFLGRRVGSFTVSLQNSSVQLALSEKESYENPTSYLRIDKIPSEYYEYSYDWFERTGFEHVDDENNNYLFGLSSDGTGMYYLKYTFYVKNVGNTTAKYKMSINLEDSSQSENGKTLDDTLRIMVFENNPAVADSHEHEVYAKNLADYRYKVYDKAGNRTYQAFVSSTPNPDAEGNVYEDDDHPLATSFLVGKGKTVIEKTVPNFKKNDVMRYTVVYWLEGEASFPEFDEEGNAIEPKGAKIKLSIDINASGYNA